MAKQHQQHEKPQPEAQPEATTPVEAEAKPVEEAPAEAVVEMLRRMND